MEQNTQREKLIDLIVNAKKACPETESFTEFLADFLIGYGVIVPDNTYELDRLRDLVQADREGRCIIAPVKPGEIAWGGHARFDPVLGETKNVIYPVILKGWWTGLKDYEYEPREFRFGDLYESYDAAEKALEGENHG